MTKEIIAQAKNVVKGNWWRIIGTTLLMTLIVLVSAFINVIPVVGAIAYILIAMYLGVGFTYYCYNVSKGAGKVSDIFFPLKDGFLRMAVLKLTGIVLLASIVFGIVVGLLSIIPFIGIILALIAYVAFIMFVIYYSVVIFVLFENPGMKVMDALKRSKELTTGHRWTWFWMQIAVYLKPILFFICGMIVLLIIGAIGGQSTLTIVSILSTIISLVYFVWLLILMPTVSLLTPAYYNKLKELKPEATVQTNEPNVEA